ncbi:MAG: penicillin-binding protein 2, partial [Armatimonadetes bacterium]|nr:penicillin-binding protein 2 [Armatimonadota bacterium]
MTKNRGRRPAGRHVAAGGPRFVAFPRARLRALLAFWVVCLVAVLARIAYLQTVRSDALSQMAVRQQSATVPLSASRGRIFDRHGRELATTMTVDSVFAVPRRIADRDAFAAAVGPILGIGPGALADRLDPSRYFQWLGRRITAQQRERLEALSLGDQIGFLAEDARRYPKGVLAAHLLGFVGIDSQGLAGLELSLDETLRGRPGEAIQPRDAIGREILEGRRVVTPARDGADVLLTIDEVIQHIAERELAQAVTAHRAVGGVAVVLDVRSGEILALANAPRFDPNSYQKVNARAWANRAIASVYEPGSTFKVLVTAAALDAGVITPRSTFFCPGTLRIPGNHVIREAHGEAHGTVRPVDVLRLSCNVGAAQIGAKMGATAMARYLSAFGIGTPTGVDLPGESPGILRPTSSWSAADVYTHAFGQGVATTPLQMAAAIAAIGNDGKRMRPYVVAQLRDANGRVRRVAEETPAAQVLRPEVARSVVSMLVRGTVDGTGQAAAIDGYTVAGKTGTAQKPGPSGGYAAGRYIASYVGLVPAS